MKKLLIAAALTASVCSFGANINAEKFDAAAVGTKPADIKEAAGEEFVNYFKADGGDASAVAAYAKNTASEKTTEAGAAGANYLNLSTEGSTLWRTINPYKVTISEDYTTTNETTTTKAAAATGTYIDTLVQFTATEAAPTTFEDGAKLAMWLQSTDNGDGTATTNLYVRGASITVPADESVLTATAANVALDATVEAGTWYRLTVKAVTVAAADTQTPITAFAIYIDGVLVNPVTSFVPQAWIDYIRAMEANLETTYFSITDMDLLKTSLVPSVTAGAAGDESLYGVGFKGTGAIDSIAWTDEELFKEVPAAFTLTITMAEGIDAVQYAIGNAAAVTYTAPVEVKAGDVVTITATAKDWWVVDEIDNPITVDGDENVKVTATAVTASDVGVTVPDGTSAEKVNAALAWAKTNNKSTIDVKNAQYFYSDYLLGFTDFSEAEPTIEIVSIEFDDDGKPVVEAKVTVDGVTKIEKLSTASLNGTLKYKAAATLEALKKATPKEAIEAGDQFIQVVVE